MCECEIIFCNSLHDRLKEKIIGKIWVGVNEDDRLFVDITQREINTTTHIISGKTFSELIVKGYSVEDACNDITKQYRRIILSHSFK